MTVEEAFEHGRSEGQSIAETWLDTKGQTITRGDITSGEVDYLADQTMDAYAKSPAATLFLRVAEEMDPENADTLANAVLDGCVAGVKEALMEFVSDQGEERFDVDGFLGEFDL